MEYCKCKKECTREEMFKYVLRNVSSCKRLEGIYGKLPDIYDNVLYAPYCEKCGKYIDYKDMSVEWFLNWLNNATENIKDETVKGKAIIRYFRLDKLLSANKN